MTITLSRRGSVAAVVVLAVALAGILSATALRGATAQEEPITVVGVFSNVEVAASNGNFSFGAGSGSADGVEGIDCGGAAPRSGANIPADVVTQLGEDATRLRVLHANGTPLTGTVLVNCTIQFSAEAQARITRGFDALR